MFDSLKHYYTDFETGEKMQPHQERVVAEKKDLDDKIGKLEAFIAESPVFRALDDEERQRLSHQHDVMVEYSAILAERIAAFTVAA